jgi:hypothetical protein
VDPSQWHELDRNTLFKGIAKFTKNWRKGADALPSSTLIQNNAD